MAASFLLVLLSKFFKLLHAMRFYENLTNNVFQKIDIVV